MTEEERTARRILVPLIAASILWQYADEVVSYCAARRLSHTAKLSRQVRQLRRDYDDYMRQHLDQFHRDVVNAAGEDFKNTFGTDLLIMFCTISNELNRKYVGVEIQDLDMRVKALCAITLRRALHTMPEMVHLPKIYELDQLLSAYVSPFELDLSDNVATMQKILAKRLSAVPDMQCRLQP